MWYTNKPPFSLLPFPRFPLTEYDLPLPTYPSSSFIFFDPPSRWLTGAHPQRSLPTIVGLLLHPLLLPGLHPNLGTVAFTKFMHVLYGFYV